MTSITGPQISRIGRAMRVAPFLAPLLFAASLFGQQGSCFPSASVPSVHAEGLAEQVGDISLTCSGPKGSYSTNILVALNANITNRLGSNGQPTGIAATVNTVGIPIATGSASLYSGTSVFISGIQYTTAIDNQSVTILIHGILVAAPTTTNTLGGLVTALVQSTGSVQISNSSPIPVAAPTTSLYDSQIYGVVPCAGSTVPATNTFAAFLQAGTPSSNLRITEGFATAFQAKTATSDTGTRILINLSGFGSGAQVYVPDAIVGNSGGTATSAGAFGWQPAGGFYAGPGELLLSRVSGADANGNGGTLVTSAPGGAASYGTVSPIALVNGAATVTYEVVDANSLLSETAQVPVFVVAPAGACNSLNSEQITAEMAPFSNVTVPTATDPIPRFVATPATSDCSLLGDCSSGYFPLLQVTQTALNFTGNSLSPPITSTPIGIVNAGAGELSFTVTVSYTSGATSVNWLTVSPLSGGNNTVLTIVTDPSALAAGVYTANLTISAGNGGTVVVPVTFNVAPPGVLIQSLVNSATQQAGPVAPGSFATLYGLNMNGSGVQVIFNGYPATVLYDSAGQINVVVPTQLSPNSSAGVYASVGGVTSNTFVAAIAANAPGVFNPGILNQDNSINTAGQPAAAGDYIQIFLTGLTFPLPGALTVNIGSATNLPAVYSGTVPSIPGLDQVNVQIPRGLTFSGNSTQLSICVPVAGAAPVCSQAVPLYMH